MVRPFLSLAQLSSTLTAPSYARVIPPDDFGTYNDSGIPLSLGYGDGSYGVKGTIGVAPFEFGDYKIDQQGGRKDTMPCKDSMLTGASQLSYMPRL